MNYYIGNLRPRSRYQALAGPHSPLLTQCGTNILKNHSSGYFKLFSAKFEYLSWTRYFNPVNLTMLPFHDNIWIYGINFQIYLIVFHFTKLIAFHCLQWAYLIVLFVWVILV